METNKLYGKVTFRVYRGDKFIQISLDTIIIRYYASYCIFDRQQVFENVREIYEVITPRIQQIVDQYVSFKKLDFTLSSYVKYQLLDEMFRSSCVHNLKAHVDTINF